MEQENKYQDAKKEQPSQSASNASHKKNHHRHKSYFIDPSAQANAQQPKKAANQESPAEEKKQSSPAPQKEQQESPANSNKSRHRNRHRSKNRNAQKNEVAEQQANKTENEVSQKSSQRHEPKNASGHSQYQQNPKNGARRSQDAILKDSVAHMQKPTMPHEALDGDYEEIRFPSINEPVIKDFEELPVENEPSPMVEVVGIRFKSSGKIYYFAPAGKQIKKGEYAIVETSRGLEYGEVALSNTTVKESDTVPPLRAIVRIATEADRKHHEDNAGKEADAFRICNEKIAEHKLDMKLIEAQYTFDNSKLLFYFTSAGRVDFRDLVKDLAGVFRTRIELRQIGIRDEAKMMGGMGMCGRPLCCTRFLSDFGQVSIKMAKEQNLSLNSAKISGICGRLMCCLRYEQDAYEYELKRTPPVGATVRTADGMGTVTEISPLLGTVKVRLVATPEIPPKTYRREDLVMLKKQQPKKKPKDSQES